METLSEVGRLYLNDYAVLAVARRDLEQFLKSICEHVARTVERGRRDIFAPNGVEWRVQNIAKGGSVQVWPLANCDLPGIRKGQCEILVQYIDIRRDEEMSAIAVSANNAVFHKSMVSNESRLARALAAGQAQGITLDFSNPENCLHYEERHLDLDSAEATGNLFSEILIRKANAIGRFLEQVVN